MRSVDEVKNDIDTISFILEELAKKPVLTQQTVSDISSKNNIDYRYIEQTLTWLHFGMNSLFLQDADSLTMRTDDILEILNHVKAKLPSINRVTTYARANTVSRKTLDELKALREAGLNRLHIGMESGSDAVLALLKKGVTSEKQIDAGRKAIEADIEVSLYFMPGCGGAVHLEDNALGSAKVINAIDPAFIRIRSVVPMPGTPLYQMMTDKQWIPSSERDKVRELRLLIENLENIRSNLISDHIMNLLEEVEGIFPNDKNEMLNTIDRFFAMDEGDQDNFIVGRRLGLYHVLSDMSKEIEPVKARLIAQYGDLDTAMRALLTRYI